MLSVVNTPSSIRNLEPASGSSWQLDWKWARQQSHPTVFVKYRNQLLEGIGLEGELEAMRQAGYLQRKTE
jgi:hypothetical protein